MVTTIQIDEAVKDNLDKLKLFQRETYNELIKRLISGSCKKAEKESLIATLEVLEDPELMKDIRIALQEKGGIALEEIEKEFGLDV